jgi:peptidoglycan/xylan/chitin deacetylase (PgdA/CDA1 family)
MVNRLQRGFSSHVLLYHATFSTVPEAMRQHLHNVAPEVIFEQVQWLKKYFDIVVLDQLFGDYAQINGKVAITFDDAYQSVFDHAVPVLTSLSVPCTIFVNGISLTGQPFWRDKVRYLISQARVGDFLRFCAPFAQAHQLRVDDFYHKTKQAMVNSAALDTLIDQYLETIDATLDELLYCVRDPSLLVDHPLISYGNHTYHHYVLSALSDVQQEEEIGSNHRLLVQAGVKMSRVFAVPFGGDNDLNDKTLGLLKQYGYDGFLYCRQAINLSRFAAGQRRQGVPFQDRYMVEPSFAAFQKQMLRLCKNSCFSGGMRLAGAS